MLYFCPGIAATLATRYEDLSHSTLREKIIANESWTGDLSPVVVEGLIHGLDGYLYRRLEFLHARFKGDFTLPLLLGEIGHRNITTLAWRNTVTPQVVNGLAAWMDHEPQHGREPLQFINPYSLSLVTGIPETTIRRKVATLVQRGWILREAGDGLRVNAGLQTTFADAYAIGLNDFLQTYARMRAVKPQA